MPWAFWYRALFLRRLLVFRSGVTERIGSRKASWLELSPRIWLQINLAPTRHAMRTVQCIHHCQHCGVQHLLRSLSALIGGLRTLLIESYNACRRVSTFSRHVRRSAHALSKTFTAPIICSSSCVRRRVCTPTRRYDVRPTGEVRQNSDTVAEGPGGRIPHMGSRHAPTPDPETFMPCFTL